MAAIVANPSDTPSASGGSPRSCRTTAGSKRFSAASASVRLPAHTTSNVSKRHLSWRCNPTSSSTTRSLRILSFIADHGDRRRSSGRQRQTDDEPRALAWRAHHLHVACALADEFAYFVRADSHPSIPFCRIERPEQPIANEFWIHSRTSIDHL